MIMMNREKHDIPHMMKQVPVPVFFHLDNDNEKPRLRLSDDQVWQQIIKLTGVQNSSSFQKLNKEIQREALRQLLDMGASVRQLQRLTGLGRGLIQRL